MYRRYYTKRFQKSFNKILRSGKINRKEVELVIDILADGKILPSKYQDHPLHGTYDGFRECHIKFNLLLVYKIKNQELVLVLFDIGSHPKLF